MSALMYDIEKKTVTAVDDVSIRQMAQPLVFDSYDSGSGSSTVTIGSYGSGRATIHAGDGRGIVANNVSNFVIQDLNLVALVVQLHPDHALAPPEEALEAA